MEWLTSDEHYGHNNMTKAGKDLCDRPFMNLDEMHAELIRRHNVLVKPEDHTWHLGDFSFNIKWVHEILPQLNGTHSLVVGNHDPAHPCQCKTKEKLDRIRQAYRDAGFKEVVDSHKMIIANRTVLMHHMPYQGDHEKERYVDYRLADNGLWLLHGHVHDSWKTKARQINVGVDQWAFAPVSIPELESIIENSIE